jgi:aspartyl-tRNA(Asn)/glutamyl-tRNA(Gln) amidotransferase subunit A
MQARDLTTITIPQIATAIRRRELSPVELTEAYLDRIEWLNPRLNAYVTVTAERARDDARRAEAEIAAGTDRGPLHGVPLALKDLFDTAGIRTAGGAKIYAERVPAADSTVARRLREAGSVLLGKLNTHELAFGVTTNNPHFGPTRNPWDTDRIPGGSSGGSGAATAAAMAAATMGSDTGGSIRIPASLCGVVGLKPTYGRVSKAGVMPLSWLFDHVGPITRTVEDAALMLAAVAGYDAADCSTVPVPVDDYPAALERGIAGLRVGVPRTWFYERLDDEVRAAVESALEVLRGLGAELREVGIPGLETITPPLFGVVVAEQQEYHAAALAERLGDFGPDVGAILGSPPAAGADLMRALRLRYTFAEAMRTVLEEVDVLVTPTTPIPAVPIGQETVTYGGATEPVLFALTRCTVPFNAAHLPALSLPCGFTAAGLPIGLQIAGRPFDEATVLRVGRAYERATDWHRRRPPVPV